VDYTSQGSLYVSELADYYASLDSRQIHHAVGDLYSQDRRFAYLKVRTILIENLKDCPPSFIFHLPCFIILENKELTV